MILSPVHTIIQTFPFETHNKPIFVSDILIFLGLTATILTIPFDHTNTIEIIGIIFAMIGWLSQKVIKKEWDIRLNPLLVPLAVYFFTILLSLIHCIDFAYTLKTIRRDFLTYTALFILIADYCRTNEKSYSVFYLFLFCNLLIIGGFCLLLPFDNFNLNQFAHPAGLNDILLRSQTHTSSYFLFTTIFTYSAFYFATQFRWSLLLMAYFSVNFMLLFLSNQRAALVGLIGAFMAHVIVFKEHRKKSLGVLFLIMSLAGISVFSTPLKTLLIHEDWSKVFKFNFSPEHIQGDSTQERVLSYMYFWQCVKKHPFKGAGYGRKNLKTIGQEWGIPKPFFIKHAHNVFLNAAVQTGLQGALALLLVLFAQFKLVWKGLQMAHGTMDKFIFTATLLYMIGFWIRMQFDDVVRHSTAFNYWMIMGIVTSIWLNMNREKRSFSE